MPDPTRRRFTLADAMILMAATTPGLVLLRIGDGLGVFEPGTPHYPGRDLIELLSVVGGCLLIPLVFVVLVLLVCDRRRALRDVIQGPGFVACAAAVIALILPVSHFVVRIVTEPMFDKAVDPAARLANFTNTLAVNFHNVFGGFTGEAGPMIIGAWLALALAGRRRPGPTWIDRAGSLIGGYLVLVYVITSIYFVLWPFLAPPGVFKIGPGRSPLALLSLLGGCLLVPLVFVLLVLRACDPRRALRDVIQGPGFLACLATLVASILPVANFSVRIGTRTAAELDYPFGIAEFLTIIFQRITVEAGPMIVGAWLAMALMGRWRLVPARMDRLGCLIGMCLIVYYVFIHVNFMYPFWSSL